MSDALKVNQFLELSEGFEAMGISLHVACGGFRDQYHFALVRDDNEEYEYMSLNDLQIAYDSIVFLNGGKSEDSSD